MVSSKRSNPTSRTEPLDLSVGWDSIPRMQYVRSPAPSAAEESRSDIAWGVRTSDHLLKAFKVRERELNAGLKGRAPTKK